MTYIKLPVTIELSEHQMFALLRGDLREGRVASASEPDGIFYSVEEKRKILEYFDNQ